MKPDHRNEQKLNLAPIQSPDSTCIVFVLQLLANSVQAGCSASTGTARKAGKTLGVGHMPKSITHLATWRSSQLQLIGQQL